MIDPATLFILVVPVVGLAFAAGLYVVTAITDKRDLARADRLERRAGT
jgi:hypothetical protein